MADARYSALLWQRGISLYYANDFAGSATQFRDDVAANPNDTEEAIWAFIAEAQLLGADRARRQFQQVSIHISIVHMESSVRSVIQSAIAGRREWLHCRIAGSADWNALHTCNCPVAERRRRRHRMCT